MQKTPPVITIDGLSSSGKGTIASLLAQHLGWHYLDSGMLYRVLAFVIDRDYSRDYENIIKSIASSINVRFEPSTGDARARVLIDNEDVSEQLYHETIGTLASKISALPEVRAALLDRQRAFRQLPGLVTDGRDMGTVVFPDAKLKLFFTADRHERAQRRYHQLQAKGIDVKVADLERELEARDQRDMRRQLSPLTVAEGGVVIDTTNLTIDELLSQIKSMVKQYLAVKI